MADNEKTSKLAREFSGIAALHRTLSEKDSHPSRMTLAKFRKYEPLFQTVNADTDHMTDVEREALTILGEDYVKAVSLYNTLEIVKSETDHTVVLTLPPILTKVKSLAPTKENDELVTANVRLSGHDVEKYSAGALFNMAKALIDGQADNVDTIAESQVVYRKCIAEFNEKYGKGNVSSEKQPAAEIDCGWDDSD